MVEVRFGPEVSPIMPRKTTRAARRSPQTRRTKPSASHQVARADQPDTRPPPRRQDLLRHRLAQEAARILAQEGAGEFERARRKAAERLDVADKRRWPANDEIELALLEYRRLFQGEAHRSQLIHLREQALEAMRMLREFNPRLVGPALSGTADINHGVDLYLFAPNPEDVILVLMERNIPWQQREEMLRYGGGARREHPVLHFVAGDTPFRLWILPEQALRNPPMDPVTDQPERGAGLSELKKLLAG